ncbi:MAG: cytochrome P450, partial [Anaerolineae bacterium]
MSNNLSLNLNPNLNLNLNPPPGPGNRPPLDELATLRDGPHAFLLRIAQEYGPILRYPIGPPIGPAFAFYLVCDPDGVKHVLQDNHKNYSKDTFQYNLLSTITGQGLLTSDGDYWLRQRRLAQPAFHRARIYSFAPTMLAITQRMLDRWRGHAAQNEPIDVAAEMMHVALQIVGATLLSIEIGDQADALARATLTVLDHIVHRARTFGIVPEWLPTRGNRRYKAAMRTLERAVYKTIAARRPTPPTPLPAQTPTPPPPLSAREGGGGEVDLLSMLMAARNPDTGEGMTEQQLRDEVITTVIAGHETVASALAWTWYLLAEHPEAEATLHAELAEVLGGRPPTVDDLSRLPYTQAIFEEALRLYPPAWIITRKALGDDEICGYRVPAGALVVTSPYVTHHLPQYWDEPEAFRPERFLPGAAAGRHRFAYYPFGGGPRLCIGNQFAMVEAVLIIASVAQRYRLRLVPGHPVAVE